MDLALLSARSDIHTVRWANALADRGHRVHVLTMHPGGSDPLRQSVEVHELPFPAPFGYYLNAFHARRLLKRLRPDLLHTHFASGYGTLGRLCGYRPYILSVWGRDVYDFPSRSRWHRRLLVKNLKAADHIGSTSHAMEEKVRSLCPEVRRLSVTPFGIDADLFRPQPSARSDGTINIGTVKKLQHHYGIDVLIKAFAEARSRLCRERPEVAARLRLLIVGGGPDRGALEKLSRRVGIGEATTFTGAVAHAQVAFYLNQLDVYVALSRTESFGVAVLEASACGRPVVVSDVGGLPEVVQDGTTGFVVRGGDPKDAATALRRLALDSDLRIHMGAAGRQRVLEHYAWSDNVATMERLYEQVLHT